jgi:predicted site-specific integrase-resolvase
MGMDEQAELPVAAEAEPVEAEVRGAVWVKNQSELAEQIGCDRKTIQRWLKAAGPDCPGHAADGRYNVTAWRQWVESKGKKVRAAVVGKDRGSLEIQNMRLRNDKLEIENQLRRGETMHVDEVCKVLTEMMSAFVLKIRGVKHTLASAVVGVSVPEASKRIGRETDEALAELALGEWAKKKLFWATVYARQQDLLRTHSLGSGQSAT